MNTTIFALVDYHNLAWIKRGANRHPIRQNENIERLVHTLAKFANWSRQYRPTLKVRLYGGWHDDDGRPSADLSTISEALRRFPTKICKVTTLLEIADRDIEAESDEERLFGTQTMVVASVPTRLSPALCGSTHPDCSLPALNDWLRTKRCPKLGCSTSLPQPIEATAQKMVDSLLVTDAVVIASKRAKPDDKIWIVSHDRDMIPGAVAASRIHSGVSVILLNRKNEVAHHRYLEQRGIEVCEWSADT